MRDALVATVVHDLKNALASLTASTGAIAERSIGSALESDTGRLHATTVALSQRLVGFLTLYRSGEAGLKAQLRDNTPADFLREVAAGLGRDSLGLAGGVERVECSRDRVALGEERHREQEQSE